MKQSDGQKQMSPVNIDQARAVGQDSPAEGSRMGREANKPHGYPGEAEQANGNHGPDDDYSSEGTADSTVSPSSNDTPDDAIRRAAYEAYLRRNGGPGDETSDWLEAEAHVRQRSGA
ncbi:DUF2934 domain-containing protein [Variovorax sp. J22G73]|uniref:DUF2934 domain-containing protein n=1 Tax=unclassified Variovorax TaxID=663243 RepID=UPI002574FE1F|nr:MULTISPECIES: DUF2934 domain-containing protein [unclassified Variovorax]MDM0009474.1 DUF2934 domain-containing protein [Variovorax sp. J22R203]MDM0101982.1 DUF2934 domain-containing protein [Variovorax sp. J22G73]